jgi:transmembrane sensor
LAPALAGVDAARRTLERRRVLNGLAGVLGLSLAGWLGWRYTPLPERVMAWRADHRTATGERRELALSDGSRVWLNTDTTLDVDDRGHVRRLILLAGEILVETAPDRLRRPFYVDTGFGRAQALGTRFAVRRDERQARLDVFAGAVEIRTAAGLIRRVDTGRAARFDAASFTALAADPLREAWHQGRLPADDLPLAALLQELGRYRRERIRVAPEVAGLKVMGVFPIDDPDRALAMLEQTLPIRVRRNPPGWIVVGPR